MPWLILIASAVFEAVWATALGMSDGPRRPVPTLVFVVAGVISMVGLARAAKHLPIGTAYSVWVGIGASLTVIWSMATGAESVTAGKVVFLTGIIGAIVGLKALPTGEPVPVPAPDKPFASDRRQR